MILLRLQGCGVGCPFCDTKQTWHLDSYHERNTIAEVLGANVLYTYRSPTEIAYYLHNQFKGVKWVLLTGGEPAQFHLAPLVAAIHDAGFKVAIETSGTETGHIDANLDWICVSPKIKMPGGKQVLPEAVEQADEVKYVVGKATDIQTFERFLEGVTLKESAQICLQPMSQSKKATELCIQTVLEKGWRLSIQTHKLLNLP